MSRIETKRWVSETAFWKITLVKFYANTRARKVSPSKLNLIHMARKASVVIEKDDNGFYAWCPELKGCQSQGATLEETISNIKEAIELYLETLPIEERDVLLSREILTTSVEVDA